MRGWTTEYKERLATEMAVKIAEMAAKGAAIALTLHGFFGALPHGDVTHGEGIRKLRTRVGDGGGIGTFRGVWSIDSGFSRDGEYMGEVGGGQGAPHHPRCGPSASHTQAWCGHPVPPLRFPFGIRLPFD